MGKSAFITVDETGQSTEIYVVWVGEKDHIASFHPVDSYELRNFARHDCFINYLRSLQERGFRFQ